MISHSNTLTFIWHCHYYAEEDLLDPKVTALDRFHCISVKIEILHGITLLCLLLETVLGRYSGLYGVGQPEQIPWDQPDWLPWAPAALWWCITTIIQKEKSTI